MALLSRLFSSRKNNKPQCNINADKNERSSWKPFTFGKDQVRVLLFRECDWRGRKLLFDSNAVQKVSLENSSCKLRFAARQKSEKCKKDGFVEVTNGYGYQYTKPSSDATLLGEMMFGAVAMTFRGTALKVHSMPSPNRLMCTKVFPSPMVTHTSRRTSDRSLEDSCGSSVNSMSEYFSQNSGSESLLASGPLDVPMGEIAVPKPSRYNSLEGDSGFCGDFSLQSISSVGSPSYWTPVASPETRTSLGSLCGNRQSGGSLSSLQRRWIRNMSTSLELGLAQTDEAPSCNPQHRRTKLGLAIVITLTEERMTEMEVFLFEHMSIIETMIERLRFSVERAYLRKETFVHVMHEAWADMQQSVCDMLCAPRLPCPIWLSLTSSENKSHSSLVSMFLHDLCLLISTLDTKATNFFVSTLVTGVLTHHLGWVNTVWPANGQPSSTTNSSEATEPLNELLRSHPYNPLWAQLGDLYGALGSPTKIAKTIITTNGRKNDCVNKLLTCMTYFIRCGEVKERTGLKQEDAKVSAINTQPSVSKKGNTCQKDEIPNLFSKCRSRRQMSKISDGTRMGAGMLERQVEELPEDVPQVDSLEKSSSTFYVSLDCDSTSETINGHHISSCVLPGGEHVGVAKMSRGQLTCSPTLHNLNCSSSENVNSPKPSKTTDIPSLTLQKSSEYPKDVRTINVCSPTVCHLHNSNELNRCAETQHACTFLGADRNGSGSVNKTYLAHKSDIAYRVTLKDESIQPCNLSGSTDTASTHRSSCLIATKEPSGTMDSQKPKPKSHFLLESQNPVCFLSAHDACLPETGATSFYVEDTQKRLDIKLDILSQEMERFKGGKRFPTHAFRGGNFASPAGAEWENEDYPSSPTSSGRTSAERELTRDMSDVLSFPNIQTFPEGNKVRNGDELRSRGIHDDTSGCSQQQGENAHHKSCHLINDFHGDRIHAGGDFHKVQACHSNTSQGAVGRVDVQGSKIDRMIGCNDGEDVVRNESDNSLRNLAENEGLHHKNSKFGLKSMKRTSTCISKLSNLKSMSIQDRSDSFSSLYPNIDELAKMENVQLETEPHYIENLISHSSNSKQKEFNSENVEHVYDNSLLAEKENLPKIITDKVSKLCRVPTSAVMFHLEPEVQETEFTVKAEENFDHKRFNSERQMAAFDHMPLHRLSHVSMPSFQSKEPEVVFVLGDNEELKGIKSCSASTSNMDSILCNTVGCEIGESNGKRSVLSACPSKVNGESFDADGETLSMIINGPNVITVKSSYIDLELESGHLKTEVGKETNWTAMENTANELTSLHMCSQSAIPRSFSVSLPVSKHRRPRKTTKLVRRHTEKYCDQCKTILKLKCHDKDRIPLEVNSCQQQAFVSCEKCYYSHLYNNTSFGSLDNPEVDWSRLYEAGAKYISRSHDHVDFRLSDARLGDDGEDLESSLEPEELKECPREDNAIFEQYDPSDEEILGPQTQNVELKMSAPKEIGYNDLNLVELPLPRSESGDFEVVGLAASLLGGISTRYVPDFVLQGCTLLPPGWEAGLRRDLTLTAKLPLLGQDVTEAVCIVANTQTWEVQLVSSHAYVVDKPGTFGVCVGMSQLVANMLESLVHLWRLRMPPEHCLLHLESKLRELYLHSQALAELLLTTEFCNMELLTTSLDLEANDVPLLLAIASTHSPQIAHRYGLSFG